MRTSPPIPFLPVARAAALIMAVLAVAPAQTAYFSYAGSGFIRNTVLPNDACGPTAAQVSGFGGAPFCTGTPPLLGGLALDQSANLI